MATIIDALIVTLNLDTSKYKQNANEASESLKKVKDAAKEGAKAESEAARQAYAERQRFNRDIEVRAQRVNQLIKGIRNQALELFAVFAAGRGIKEFISSITTSDAATGRLALNISIAAERLGVWQSAAEKFGGTAAATGSTLQGLASNFQQLALTGQSGVLPYFRALGVTFTGTERDLLGLNKAVQGMSRPRAVFMLRGAGIDEGTINLLLKTPQALRALLDEQRRLGVATEEDTRKAQALQAAFLSTQQVLTSLARTILVTVGPAITGLLTQLNNWLTATHDGTQSNRDWIASGIVQAFSDLSKFLASIDWNRLITGVSSFASGADSAAQFLGGWLRATELLFGLWLGSKFLAVLANVSQLAAMGAVSGGLGALATRLTAIVALTAAAGVGAYKLTQLIDPDNKAGKYLYENSPGGFGGISDWLHRNTGGHVGLSRQEQAEFTRTGKMPDRPERTDDGQAKSNSILEDIRDWLFKSSAKKVSYNSDESSTPRVYQVGYGGGSGRVVGGGMGRPIGGGSFSGGRASAPISGSLQDLSDAAAQKYGVPKEFARAIFGAEGGLNPNGSARTSSAGAIGAGQLMPGTAADLRVNPYNMADNVDGSVRYMKRLLDQFGGNTSAAAAAYNAGPNAASVRRFYNTGDSSRLPPETKKYIGTVGRNMGAPSPSDTPSPGPRSRMYEASNMGTGAGMMARYNQGNTSNNNTNDNSSVSHINGPITVNTQATDAKGIARDIGVEVSRRSMVTHINTGLA